MTCHTGPSGLSTFGRAAPRFCAATGVATDAAKAAIRIRRAAQTAAPCNLDFIKISPSCNLSARAFKPVQEAAPCCHQDYLDGCRTDREGSTACSNTVVHCRQRRCDDSL